MGIDTTVATVEKMDRTLYVQLGAKNKFTFDSKGLFPDK